MENPEVVQAWSRLLRVPALRFALVVAISVTVAGTALHLADQPRWNINFAEGDVIRTPDRSFAIAALDLIPEPGELTDDRQVESFHDRQQQLADLTATGPLTLERAGSVSPLERKPSSPADLPALYWIQIAVGFGAMIIAGWVWSLRPRHLPSSLFALSGLATLLFTNAAAVYTTRDLALPAALFRSLTMTNTFGACLFGIAMIGLFLVYPLHLGRWRQLMLAQVVAFGGWTAWSLAGGLPAWAGGNLITLTEMIVIVIALVAQFFASRGKPQERAALSWLGLSVLLGAGGFITLNALPLVIGANVRVEQGYAFLLFLAIYFGLAAGITRYRLFDVGRWGFSFLFYFLGAFLLLMLDATLIYLIGVDRLPALGVSFFAVGLLYLPLRDSLQRRFRKQSTVSPHALIDGAMQVALSPTLADRDARWRSLLNRLYVPLDVSVTSNVESQRVRLNNNGLELLIPPVAGTAPLRLSHPQRGRTLFSQQSVALAESLIMLVERAVSSRNAYEEGAREERIRIAQDLHDDVGARLLGGLHASEDKLRAIIQESISDIASIVRRITGEKMLLADALADIRSECLARLDAAGIEADWPAEIAVDPALRVSYPVHKAITSVLRETVSNVIRHAGASRLQLGMTVTDDVFEATIADDGAGFPAAAPAGAAGFGLRSMKKRVDELHGSFVMVNTGHGARIEVRIPLVEPVQVEPVQVEPVQVEPVQVEPVQVEPAPAEPQARVGAG